MSESLDKLIDKVVSKKGLFKVPSWWIRRIFDKINESLKSIEKKLNNSILNISKSLNSIEITTEINRININSLKYEDKYGSKITSSHNVVHIMDSDRSYINFDLSKSGSNYVGTFRHTEMLSFDSSLSVILKLDFCNSQIRKDFSFNGFTNLEELGLPFNYACNIPSCNSLFKNCAKLKKIYIRRYRSTIDNNLGTLLSPSTLEASNMFSGCTSLTSIDLEKGYPINILDMSSMFSGCSNLTTVKLPSIKPTRCSNITNMFRDCKSLESAPPIGEFFKGCPIKNFTNVFEGCTKLKAETLSSGEFTVNSLYHTFSGCESLEQIDLRSLKFEGPIDLSSAFYNCKSLKKILFPSDKIVTVKEHGLWDAFRNCNSLTELDLSMFDCENSVQYKFGNMPELTTIKFYKLKFERLSNGFSNMPKLSIITGEIYNIVYSITLDCPLTTDSAMVIINGLVPYTSTTKSEYVKFRKSTYDQLTPEQIKVATDKGWEVQYIEETATTEEA